MLKGEEGLQSAAFNSRVLQTITDTEYKQFQSRELQRVSSPAPDVRCRWHWNREGRSPTVSYIPHVVEILHRGTHSQAKPRGRTDCGVHDFISSHPRFADFPWTHSEHTAVTLGNAGSWVSPHTWFGFVPRHLNIWCHGSCLHSVRSPCLVRGPWDGLMSPSLQHLVPGFKRTRSRRILAYMGFNIDVFHIIVWISTCFLAFYLSAEHRRFESQDDGLCDWTGGLGQADSPMAWPMSSRDSLGTTWWATGCKNPGAPDTANESIMWYF